MYLKSELHILTHGEDPSDSRPESAENGKVFVVIFFQMLVFFFICMINTLLNPIDNQTVLGTYLLKLPQFSESASGLQELELTVVHHGVVKIVEPQMQIHHHHLQF